jgi:UDP-N-acetyl-2-amino-2-deoxyglucuronate dehydrogenase
VRASIYILVLVRARKGRDMDPIRFGLIGCGENAKTSIVKAINQTPLARVVAAMDVKLDLARDLAEETGAERYTDRLEDVLQDDAVEAVVVSTPHYLHVPQGVEAAKRGKHVLMDKPLSTNVADAQALIAACEREGVQLGVLFPMRLEETCTAAAELVKRGVLGRVTGYCCVRVWHKPDTYWSGGYSGRVQTDWRTKKGTSGGGMLMINYSHNLDRLHNLLGLEPQSVYAQCDTFDTPVEVEDYFSVIVRYRKGAIGTLLGSSATHGGASIPDQIFGTAGTIALSNPVRYLTQAQIPGIEPGEWHDAARDELGTAGGYLRIVENYARAVRGEEALIVTGRNALSSLQVVEAAYRSQETGAPIVL